MKALHKDFWMEIRRNKARFISIFFIVALGVAFFSGIQASSPDMRFSGDAYYDEAKLMDLKVMGTMGLTQEDVDAVKSVSGVEDAEGAYSTDVICGDGETVKVLHIESVDERMNALKAKEGRIPEKSGEIFLDSAFAEAQGYQVGDRISLTQEEDSELLLREEFTVTGIGSSPLYISFNRGNSTIGSGEVNGFAYVLPEDFDQEIFTQIYIQVHGAREQTSYTDGYDNLIDKIMERVEGIEKERCEYRYNSVVADAQAELDDARKELEDGKKEAKEELDKAAKEIKDAEKELKKGKKEYNKGKKELEDARKELEDGRVQLADAKKEIADGRVQLADAKAKTADGWNQLTDAKNTVAAGWEEYNVNKKKYDEGKKQFDAGKKELEKGIAQIEQGKQKLQDAQAELDAGKIQIEEGKKQIAAGRVELGNKKAQCEAGLEQVVQGEAALAQGEAALAEAIAQLEAMKAQYEQAAASGQYTEEQLAQMAVQIEAFQQTVDSRKAEIEANRTQLAASRSELEAGLAAIEKGDAELDAQEQLLLEKEAGLPKAQEEIDRGREELKVQEAKLEPAKQEIKEKEKEIKAAKQQLDAGKQELLQGQAEIDASEAQLVSAEEQIRANEKKLSDGEQEIRDSEKELADGEKEIADGEKELADARKEIKDGEKELADGQQEYEEAKADAEKEIADGEKEIEDAQKEIDELEQPEWIVTDRHDLPEYSDYGDNADRIRNIGQVFPVIFFLVAALVSLTTMTRMVEEQRTQIGTLKALGYGKYAIASKYINYALLATVGGSILGILIGEKILPYIIITAYGIMYHNMASNLQIHYEFQFAMIASGAAIFCTIGATLFSCYRALVETPASLMRPPAPKEGKRVLAERLTFIWKHLSFTWKSTLRNLFRYKKRLFMTIFGIAGSMALMLVGFGIQDSIMDIAAKQYTKLQHYDGTIIGDEDASDKEKEELEAYLESNTQLDHYTHIQLTKMDAPRGRSNLSVYVYVPEDLEGFGRDVTLRNRITREEYELTDEGAVICEKTASLLGLEVGDEITLTKENTQYQVKVALITENYMGHYVYMTQKVYEEAFGEKPEYLNTVFTMKEEYKDKMTDTGNEVLKYPAALSISYTSSLSAQLERMLSTLGMVIIVLIVSAGMLAFVVLYNLNNINITERQRELATLKVLGFYDKEVSAYVFRENVLLTFIGVLAGAVFGIFLHRYIITTVEVDAVMFGRNIKPVSFLYSGLFTVGFSVIVNLFMHFKLKKIDMVESLKSVE
ncbi:MAG: FtsX-like permease family protein [Blautia sp.]|nr:FtsX-like permease family protein [Blautia sp.]